MKKILDWIKKNKWEVFDFLIYWTIGILLIYSNIEVWRFMILIPLILIYGDIHIKKEKEKNGKN